MKLHHTVNHLPVEEIAESIEIKGIIPQVADVYKDLVPEKIRYLPIVWLSEGIWQGQDLPVFEVDTKNLDKSKLYPCDITTETDKHLGWWVYRGSIPPSNITRLNFQILG